MPLDINKLTPAEKNTFKRKQKIRDCYTKLKEKHPKWRYDAIIAEIAENHHHFSERTIMGALAYEWENRIESKYKIKIT